MMGVEDCYQQTINGTTATYALDISSELSQVLNDGTGDYFFGLQRLAQQSNSSLDYFLLDIPDFLSGQLLHT